LDEYENTREVKKPDKFKPSYKPEEDVDGKMKKFTIKNESVDLEESDSWLERYRTRFAEQRRILDDLDKRISALERVLDEKSK